MQCSLENTPSFFSHKAIAHAMKHLSVTLSFSGIWDSKNRSRPHTYGERGLHVTCHQQQTSIALMWCSLRLLFWLCSLAFSLLSRKAKCHNHQVCHSCALGFLKQYCVSLQDCIEIDWLHEITLSVLPCPQPSTTAINAYFFCTDLLPLHLPQSVTETKK